MSNIQPINFFHSAAFHKLKNSSYCYIIIEEEFSKFENFFSSCIGISKTWEEKYNRDHLGFLYDYITKHIYQPEIILFMLTTNILLNISRTSLSRLTICTISTGNTDANAWKFITSSKPQPRKRFSNVNVLVTRKTCTVRRGKTYTRFLS